MSKNHDQLYEKIADHRCAGCALMATISFEPKLLARLGTTDDENERTPGNKAITSPSHFANLVRELGQIKIRAVAVVLSIGLFFTTLAPVANAEELVSLRGAGSTFSGPLYKKWIDEYNVSHRNVSITYDAVGSSEGVKRFLAEAVDFAGSDEILSDGENTQFPGAIMLPVTAGMIVLAYNIPGVNSEIKLPRDVYVDIFTRKIRKWDDPRIAAADPESCFRAATSRLWCAWKAVGRPLPSPTIFAALGPSWRAAGMGVGKLFEWPSGVLLAPGNEGVAARIRLSEGSIGYVEYWFAQRLGLRMAALQNRSGEFITPTANSGQLALSGRVAQVKELAASVFDPTSSGSYPITTYSWMLLYPQYRDRAKGTAVQEFAQWALSQVGQNFGAQLGYLPLSDDVVSIGKQALGPVVH